MRSESDGTQTGLYYYRARYYDPLIGRFISEDPIGLAGGINPYVYAANDPVNLRDPSGLCPVKDAIKGKCRILLPGVTVVGEPQQQPAPQVPDPTEFDVLDLVVHVWWQAGRNRQPAGRSP